MNRSIPSLHSSARPLTANLDRICGSTFKAADTSRSTCAENALRQLDSLIGMKTVKEQIREIIRSIQFQQGSDTETSSRIFIIVGNPGTGKTTLAGILSQLLYSCSVTDDPAMSRISFREMLGRNSLETPAAIRSAKERGALLYIDEFVGYRYFSDLDPRFYLEPFNQMKNWIADPDRALPLVISMYPSDLEAFFEVDESFMRRCAVITLDDPTGEELFDAFRMMAFQKGLKIDDEALALLRKRFDDIAASDDPVKSGFGCVGPLISRVTDNRAARVLNSGISPDSEEALVITAADIPD